MKRSKLAVVGVALSLFIGTAAQADITFVANYTDTAGEGFFDPTFGAQRQAAFEYALNVWGGTFSNTYVGQTITVNAAFNPMGGSGSGAVLGSAGAVNHFRDFASSHPEFLANTWYGAPLANNLFGADGVAGAEISAQFNSDVDDGVVLGATDWYYGTDASPGSDIDFVTVALHEIGHGLNFQALVSSAGALAGGFPGIYDRFLEDAAGTDLTAMATNGDRAAALISTNLFWNGAGGIAGNGGTRPELWAPNPFQGGSSTSHLDETTLGSELMSPFYSGADHIFSAIELGMLDDMGWTLIPEPASLALLGLAGLILLRRRAA